MALVGTEEDAPAQTRAIGTWRFALPVALSLTFSFVFIARTAFRVGGETFFTLFDDAMISMRYARNLVEGHGLLWNPGQPAVEGYSNTLWTLWMSVVHLFGLPDSKTSLVVTVAGALLLAVAVVLTGAVVERLTPAARGASLLAMLLTALF